MTRVSKYQNQSRQRQESAYPCPNRQTLPELALYALLVPHSVANSEKSKQV